MLFQLLRRHMKNILGVTVIVILPAFVMWGTGTGSGSTLSTAVALRIDEEEISPREFAQAVRQAERFVGPENAVSTAIDTLLDDYVVRRACAELDIVIAAGDIQDRLKQNPSFRNADGSFNADRWNATLRRKDVDWSGSIGAARRGLERQRLFELIQATVQISPTEVRARYEQDYARRRVRYVTLDPEAFTGEVTVDEAELAAYFEEHRARYEAPATVRLAVVAWPKEPNAEDRLEIQSLLGDLKRQLLEGADFAELAEQYSQGPTAAQGGDLGYFPPDGMVAPFAEAAFALPPGAVSDPVKTQFGWHLIKVEDRREGEDGAEVRARHILIHDDASLETLAGLHEAASGLAAAAADRTLAEAASEAELEVTWTEPLARTATTIPGIGSAQEILAVAFDLEPGQSTGVLDLPDAFVVAEAVEQVEAHLRPLAEVRAEAEADYRLARAGELAGERATRVVEAARAAGDLAAVAPALAGPVVDTGLFTRVGFVADLGRPPAFIDAAFALQPGEISSPLRHGQRWLVLQVREAAPADPEGFETQANLIRLQLEQQRRGQAIQDFIVARKSQLRVVENTQITGQMRAGI